MMTTFRRAMGADNFRLSDAMHIAEMAFLIAAVGSVIMAWVAMGVMLYRG